MNLELLEEINSLRRAHKSFSEIGEITGLARSTVLLCYRLNTILETYYTEKITALQHTIDERNASIVGLKNTIADNETIIHKQNALLESDTENYVVVSKQAYEELKHDLVIKKAEVDSLSRQLHYKESYLEYLSLTDKLLLLLK